MSHKWANEVITHTKLNWPYFIIGGIVGVVVFLLNI